MGKMHSAALTLSLALALPIAAQPIVLNTDIFPPYQIRTNEGLDGLSIRALDCVFSEMGQTYEIKVLPWERAIYEVEQNRADAFFSAIEMPRAETYATLSAPLALEKWYWYSNKPLSLPEQEASPLRTGAIRGSNQLAWLQEQGITVQQLVGTNEQLLNLLNRGRIDRFLADQSTLRTELTRQPVSLRPGYSQFYKYATLGVYFANRALAREPNLLEQFNRQIFFCLTETPALDDAEKSSLLSLYRELYSAWPALNELLGAIRQQNRDHAELTIRDIVALDKQWVEDKASGATPLTDALLAKPSSRWLQAEQQASKGLITEIMLTDRLGLLAAASEPTTDYWQGDEAKFSEAFFADGAKPYLGALRYDQSSEAYQVHISSPVRDPVDGEVIGTLIIGLNIERALLKAGMGEAL